MMKKCILGSLSLAACFALASAGCASEAGGGTATTGQRYSASKLADDCIAQCETSQALGCGESVSGCVAECLYVDPVHPQCMNAYGAFIGCAAALPAEGFVCNPETGAAMVAGCPAEDAALYECQGGASPKGLNGICQAQCRRLQGLECSQPLEACEEECTFWSDYEMVCGLEYQHYMTCVTKAAPDEWMCLSFEEMSFAVPVAESCLEQQDALYACLGGYF